ncbi:single-stranded-DNA-specific exonuclease [Lactobacillus phage Ldl1]|uniref:Single-stranded-DNA-specific exonuclease n=1 Tax=Lactobacillus phage Ldl1 TaxID=1552735 RepID=A0A0A7DMS6_9CAUD|nr:RecJ-like ssDNA exonuclease [Lactobacillus phage Ldl1]AIS73903.1 single-stranded-DNA-specific exonuclease [Lactobacillus phage Ldl1]
MKQLKLDELTQGNHLKMRIGVDGNDLVGNALKNRKINLDKLPELQNGDLDFCRDFDISNVFGLNEKHDWARDLLEQIKTVGKDNINIAILVDPDGDGFTSGALMYNYLHDKLGVKHLKTLLPLSKEHGIDIFYKNHMFSNSWGKFDALILPDSSVNDLDTITTLHENYGIVSYVIDHHILENDIESFVFNKKYQKFFKVVSDQLSINQKITREFTGVGMSWLFCKRLDELLTRNYQELVENNHINANLYLDLVAIGQISDVSDTREEDLHIIVMTGLNNLYNNLLKQFAKEKTLSCIKDVQFSFVPMINSVSRVGKKEDREVLIQALTNQDQEFLVTKKRKNRSTGHFELRSERQNIYEYAVDMLQRVKRTQDSIVRKAVNEMSDDDEKIDSVIVKTLPDKYDTGIAGLIANKIQGKYHLPALVISSDLRGSARSPRNYGNLKDVLSDFGSVKYALGHEQAFGVGINDIDDFISEFRSSDLANDDEYVYPVDKVYINDLPTVDECQIVSDFKQVWSGVNDEPVVGVLGLDISKAQVNTKNGTLKIIVDDIEIVQFNSDLDIDNNFNRFNCYVDIVGKPSTNKFYGRTSNQLVVDEIRFSQPIYEDDDTQTFNFEGDWF